MGKFFTSALAILGAVTAATSTTGCIIWFLFDEPEMPASLIEK